MIDRRPEDTGCSGYTTSNDLSIKGTLLITFIYFS